MNFCIDKEFWISLIMMKLVSANFKEFLFWEKFVNNEIYFSCPYFKRNKQSFLDICMPSRNDAPSIPFSHRLIFCLEIGWNYSFSHFQTPRCGDVIYECSLRKPIEEPKCTLKQSSFDKTRKHRFAGTVYLASLGAWDWKSQGWFKQTW